MQRPANGSGSSDDKYGISFVQWKLCFNLMHNARETAVARAMEVIEGMGLRDTQEKAVKSQIKDIIRQLAIEPANQLWENVWEDEKSSDPHMVGMPSQKLNELDRDIYESPFRPE